MRKLLAKKVSVTYSLTDNFNSRAGKNQQYKQWKERKEQKSKIDPRTGLKGDWRDCTADNVWWARPLLINCIVNSLGEGSQTCASWAGGSKQARREGGGGLRGGWLLTWVYAGFDAQQLVIWHLVVSGTGSQHLSSTRVGRRREGRLAGDLRRQFKRHSGEKSIKCNRSDVASWQAGDLSQHMSRTRVCRRREERPSSRRFEIPAHYLIHRNSSLRSLRRLRIWDSWNSDFWNLSYISGNV